MACSGERARAPILFVKTHQAIPALHKIRFRTQCDRGALFGLFEVNQLPPPPMADVPEELNSYAVTMRHDLFDIDGLNRGRVQEILLAMRQWAEQQVAIPF